MKLFKKTSLLFILAFVSLMSCKKHTDNKQAATPTLSTDEYIHYTVNGNQYSYNRPFDEILADTLTESMTFANFADIRGNRNPNNPADFTRISYQRPNGLGNTFRLGLFAVPQAEVYPYVATSSSLIYVTVTEYGNIGEYIAGNFSGAIVGPAPNNTTYNITCDFRVRRRQ